MKLEKKIWELQHMSICKIVGMALDAEDLKKIGRKFGLILQDTRLDEEFAFHSAIVGMCAKENSLSKHVQRLIEKRFLPYAKRLAEQDASDMTELVLNGSENSGVPLWAILWRSVTKRLSDGDKLETLVFGRIHMLEHHLLKDFWNTHKDQEEDHRRKEEVAKLRKELMELRSSNAKLTQTNLSMANRLMEFRIEAAASPSAVSAEAPIDSASLTKKIGDLKRILDDTRERNRELEWECSRSKSQVKALTQELINRETSCSASAQQSAPDACSCPLTHCLRGKRIAMVGGIDSLEAHYKRLVEESGGEFCRHDGRCCQGERKLEDCIRNADLVICPISVNSHFATTGVKRVCKRHGVSCCFPDSAGLGTLRTVLLQHFSSDQEISGVQQRSWQ